MGSESREANWYQINNKEEINCGPFSLLPLYKHVYIFWQNLSCFLLAKPFSLVPKNQYPPNKPSRHFLVRLILSYLNLILIIINQFRDFIWCHHVLTAYGAWTWGYYKLKWARCRWSFTNKMWRYFPICILQVWTKITSYRELKGGGDHEAISQKSGQKKISPFFQENAIAL